MPNVKSLKASFQFQGWTIRYDVYPAATNDTRKPIVFVHGTPWSSDVFKPLAEGLSATGRFQTILYDLPGYGVSQELQTNASASPSAKFVGDTSVKFQATALAALLERLELNQGAKPAVIAHDIAGVIALRAHLIHGCEFSSLLLMDTNAVLPWGDGFYKLVRSEPDTFLKLPPNIFDAVVRAVIRSACFNPQVLASGWEDILAEPWIKGANDSHDSDDKRRSFVRQIAQANDSDVAEMLDQSMYNQIRCPVKILWGHDDKWIPEEKMRRLADLLKHCLEEFVVIDAAGHLIMLDQPERISCEIMNWVDRY